jgi:hypothetical protein
MTGQMPTRLAGEESVHGFTDVLESFCCRSCQTP